jgi:metallo-beta-lactamase family protein
MVVFVGYQAGGTRGRSLVDGATRIKIHGEWFPVRAEVVRLDAFSAHADREELIRWVTSSDRLPEKIVLVHGEPDGRQALAQVLRERLGATVLVPRQGAVLTV